MFSEAIRTYALSVPPGESSESSSDPIAPPTKDDRDGPCAGEGADNLKALDAQMWAK
jgi:hypothetical protein